MSKRTLTPKLRFPEFLDKGGWEEKTGDNLFDQICDRNPTPGLPVLAITQEHGAIPRDMIDYHVTVTEKSIESYKVVQIGDFIISLRSFQGGIEYSHYHGICSPAYVILRRRTEGSDAYFKHYLKTDRFIRVLTRNLEGLRDGKMISYRQFSELLLPVPSPPEQQKIAECLGSLDEVIAAEDRMLEAIKTYKKGLMQQLFPQPGETKPRLRFPEYRDKGEWKPIILGDVVSILKGKGIAKSDVVASGKTPCIRYAELYTIYGEVITQVHSRTDVPVDKLVLSQAGDVIIPASGETKEEIATCGCVMDAGVALGSDLNVLRSGIDGRFLSYYLNGVQRSELAKVAQGDAVAHLYPAQISRLSISITEELSEQHRIANCLSALDARVTAQAAKIDSLKTHKRGLMQILFATSEEK